MSNRSTCDWRFTTKHLIDTDCEFRVNRITMNFRDSREEFHGKVEQYRY